MKGTFSQQLCALLTARALIARRSWRTHLLLLLSGLFALLILSALQQLADSILTSGIPSPPFSPPLGHLTRCTPLPGTLRPTPNGSFEPGCYSLLFLPRDPRTVALVSAAVGASRLGDDVRSLPGAVRWPLAPLHAGWVDASLLREGATDCGEARGRCGEPAAWLSGACAPCAFALDNKTLTTLTMAFPDAVRVVALNLGAYLADHVRGDSSFLYLHNASAAGWPLLRPGTTSEVKRLLDAELLRAGALPQPPPLLPPLSLSFSLRGFPTAPTLGGGGFDAFARTGAQWTFLMPALLCFQLLCAVVAERETGLRAALTAAGLRRAAYWAAWVVSAAAAGLISTLLLLASGYALRLPFFLRSAPAATAALYLLTCAAYAAYALALSTLVGNAKAAAVVGGAATLMSYTFILVVSTGGSELLGLMWLRDMEGWKAALRTLFLLLCPALAYASVASDIAGRCAPGGPGFSMTDLATPSVGEALGQPFARPSPLWCVALGRAARPCWGCLRRAMPSSPPPPNTPPPTRPTHRRTPPQVSRRAAF